MATFRPINDAALDLIKGFESFEATVYKDGNGFPTVGWGHKLLPGESFPDGVTRAQADGILRQDCEVAERAVAKYVEGELTDNEYGACVSLCFNIGSGNFQKSTVARLLNEGDKPAACTAFMNWDHVGTAVSDGLARRRRSEQALFNTGGGDGMASA